MHAVQCHLFDTHELLKVELLKQLKMLQLVTKNSAAAAPPPWCAVNATRARVNERNWEIEKQWFVCFFFHSVNSKEEFII